MVDYWVDSSKVWIDNAKGPGASCHVFTYYKQVTQEASHMITGLGKMVISRYDKDLAALMFNLDHFKGNSGYRWIEDQGRFSTPLDRQMKQNYRYDNNLQAVNILRELENEEKANQKTNEKEKGEEKDMLIVVGKQKDGKRISVEEVMNKEENIPASDDKSESSLTTTGKMIRDQQLTTLAKKRDDTDLDSIDDTSIDRDRIHELELLDDDESVASSLTEMSKEEESEIESFSDFSISSAGSLSSGISTVMGSGRSDEMLKLIRQIAGSSDKPLTDEELRTAVRNYQLHKFNKKQQMFTATLENFIDTRNKQNNEQSKAKDDDSKVSSNVSFLSKEFSLPPNSIKERSEEVVKKITNDCNETHDDAVGSSAVQSNTANKDDDPNSNPTVTDEPTANENEEKKDTTSSSTNSTQQKQDENGNTETKLSSVDISQNKDLPEESKDKKSSDNESSDNKETSVEKEGESQSGNNEDILTTVPPPKEGVSEDSQQLQSQTFDDDDPDDSLSKIEEEVSAIRPRKKFPQVTAIRTSERLQLLQKSQRSKNTTQVSGAKADRWR